MRGTRQLQLGPFEARVNPLILVAVGITVFTLIRLGLWQLDRAELKLATQQSFEQRQAAFPTPIEQLDRTDSEALKHLKISLAGTYVSNRDILIGNRVYHGDYGYEVITPFILASSGEMVFISRGWVRGMPDRSVLPEIEATEGVQMLLGHLYVPPPQSFYKPGKLGGKWPAVVSYFEVAASAEAFQKPAFPYVVRLDENSPGVLTRPWPKPHLKASDSQSYAMQWFAMALAVVLITLYFGTNIRRLWER